MTEICFISCHIILGVIVLLTKRLIAVFSLYCGWQREIRDRIFCSVKFKCLLWILSLPFARSYIIYFSQLSCRSLFEELICRRKRLEMHKEEAFWGSFFSICGCLELTMSNRGGKLASKPNLCLYEWSLRIKKMLFKRIRHNQKPNCSPPKQAAGRQKQSCRQ